MTFSISSASNSCRLQFAFLSYGVIVGALVTYNLRWKYLGDIFGRRQAKSLPNTVVVAPPDDDDEQKKNKKKPIIVLLHGMWHDASCYYELQLFLKEYGYTSYAIDLLPGERFLPGFTQQEIVADLEMTLLQSSSNNDDDDTEYIFLGHSQGGLVVQSCLLNSPTLKTRTKGVVLLGTFPLGMTPLSINFLKKIIHEPRNMYNQFGYAGICFTGKLISLGYLKHIFLLPTTDLNTLTEYTTKLLNAPSDGLITMSHFPQRVGIISSKPTLILGAEQDIIYPPHLLKEDFKSRFPKATHKTIPNQAHCFMDPIKKDEAHGERNMKHVLVKWLDDITE